MEVGVPLSGFPKLPSTQQKIGVGGRGSERFIFVLVQELFLFQIIIKHLFILEQPLEKSGARFVPKHSCGGGYINP